MEKAIFLDKDGTLIPDIPYNADSGLISLNEFASEALHNLKQAGYKLIVISNQSGIAKGFFPFEALDGINKQINELLRPFNIEIDAFFYCPHFAGGTVPEYSVDCDCRKPKTGLFEKASSVFNIDLSASWMIGDILNDCEAGNAAGCRTILIENGNETEWELTVNREPDFIVTDLLEAASIILSFEIGNQMYEPVRRLKK
ncbi:MAG TPA: HAD family hydrolase [Flavitalea sp.]|nr:HAD family hydrolase [Flavitalea sp.]